MEQGKTVIIGAGHVGSHCASALALAGICREVVLVDIDKEKAHAQAQDVADSVSFLQWEVTVRDGGFEECRGADLIVVSIGQPRLPGQTRLDVMNDSVRMAKEMLASMKPYPITGIVVVITNPVDIIADYVRKGLGLPRNRVFGTGTLLDTARLVRILSQASGVARSSVCAYCLGEHGDSSVVAFSAASLGGIPFSSYHIPKEWVLEETREAGMTIINGKGSTEFGIGRALCEMAACILRDEKKILPASVLLEGEYGQSGVHCGVPCLIGKDGIEKIIQLALNEEEMEQLGRSCQVISRHIEKAAQI